MTGLIITLINKRYGTPTLEQMPSVLKYSWNDTVESRYCVIYDSMSWDKERRNKFGPLELVYGIARGGILLGGSLKVSILTGDTFFGLYSIKELQDQPEVKRANRLDPGIIFF